MGHEPLGLLATLPTQCSRPATTEPTLPLMQALTIPSWISECVVSFTQAIQDPTCMQLGLDVCSFAVALTNHDPNYSIDFVMSNSSESIQHAGTLLPL